MRRHLRSNAYRAAVLAAIYFPLAAAAVPPGNASVSLTLTSSANPVVYGSPFTITATVAAATAGGPVPTGTLSFYDGSVNLGWIATLDKRGQGSLPIPEPLASPAVCPCPAAAAALVLGAGPHIISVSYSGDSNYAAVQSADLSPAAVLNQQVTKASTRMITALPSGGGVAASVAMAPGPSGGPFHFWTPTASGGEQDGNPTGSVQFFYGSTLAATAMLQPDTSANVTSQVVLGAGQLTSALTAAVYTGDANFEASTAGPPGSPVVVNAAGYQLSNLAPDEIATIFGANLTDSTAAAGVLPLPSELAGITVNLVDNAGTDRQAPLYYASPGQINFSIPAAIAAGWGTLVVTNSGGATFQIPVSISPVSPGLFSANGDGRGVAAAQIVRVHSDLSQTIEDVAAFDTGSGRFSAVPIDFGSDDLYLVLYGTGFRNRSSERNVTCTIDGMSLPVMYAGAQPQYPGLDQIDLALPGSLSGAGEVTVVVMVDGQMSNTVTVAFQ